MLVECLTGFDGACPRDPQGIQTTGEGNFLIQPGWRAKPGISEEVMGMGSRLSARFLNSSASQQVVRLTIDWGTALRTEHHDLGYFRDSMNPDWRMIPGEREGQFVRFTLTLVPGLTAFGLYPEFNYGDHLTWMEGIKARGGEIIELGRSQQGRGIFQLRFPSPSPQAKTLFLQARDHAYETAGSFCMVGIADFLLSDHALARYLRSKFQILMTPMTNPDGVHDGMSRLTHEQGADLNRVQTVLDAAHETLQQALDRARPWAHLNIHSWTDKFTDGLLVNESWLAERVQVLMPDDTLHAKHWRVETRDDWMKQAGVTEVPKAARSWKDYCAARFRATCATFEFPWFLLDAPSMQAKGARAFSAFALALIAEQHL